MSSNPYAYPADLDSDDGLGYDDWSDDEEDTLADNMSSMNINPPGHPSPPPRYSGSGSSSTTSLPDYTATVDQLCVICKRKPRYSGNGKSYPTCGLTCAAKLRQAAQDTTSAPPPAGYGAPPDFAFTALSGRVASATGSPNRGASRRIVNRPSISNLGGSAFRPRPHPRPVQPDKPICVVCKIRSVHGDYVTCGFSCIEKLSKDGGDPTMCDYCHRNPRLTGEKQCGPACAEKAKNACLLCKCQPRNGKYHLCGKTCKRISTKSTPLILEAPEGHKTYEMVEKKFQSGWKDTTRPMPKIKKVFKIIENEEFLRPYDAYRKAVKNETFRYHGTGRQCQLGVMTTQLCTSSSYPVCNILKTSFKVSIAKTTGAFGAGVYSSSASNKAYSYCGASGAMLLTKVVLGKVRQVSGWNEVMACPPGFNSVVFDRMGGNLNETIVYDNDAIRPVFLIMF
ncbi:hypothetical protein D9611_000900 [Ephemerocybe angulata]|uniref:PARP catalytic domain-containing protein n=1 Tax=Ephemerocybe angulata TaxID=980116 RepID=A0A8H5F770_9AGAR|nr:hypothetical protein D9611_000900 [Tulosesus angulatus]